MDPVPEIVTAPDQPMTHDEKQFFRQLGTRVAALRKDSERHCSQTRNYCSKNSGLPPGLASRSCCGL